MCAWSSRLTCGVIARLSVLWSLASFRGCVRAYMRVCVCTRLSECVCLVPVSASASASHRVLCGRCVGVLVYVRGSQSLADEASTPGLGPSSGRVSRAFLQGLSLPLVPATRRGVAGSRPGWKQSGDMRCCLWPWVRLLAACPRQRASRDLVHGPAPHPGSCPGLALQLLGPCYSASVLTFWYLRG